MVKNLPANAGDAGDAIHPWVRKIPWRRAWQPTPVFLPGESQGDPRIHGVTQSQTRLRQLGTRILMLRFYILIFLCLKITTCIHPSLVC